MYLIVNGMDEQYKREIERKYAEKVAMHCASEGLKRKYTTGVEFTYAYRQSCRHRRYFDALYSIIYLYSLHINTQTPHS